MNAKHLEIQQLIGAFNEFVEAIVSEGAAGATVLKPLVSMVTFLYKDTCFRFLLGVHDGGWDRVRVDRMSEVTTATNQIRRYTDAVRGGTASEVLGPAMHAFNVAEAKLDLLQESSSNIEPTASVPSGIFDGYETLIKTGETFASVMASLSEDDRSKYKSLGTKTKTLFNKARALLKQQVELGYTEFSSIGLKKEFESCVRGIERFTERIKTATASAAKMKRVRCIRCTTVIESKHRHDFVRCACKKVAVDGGADCPRIVGNPEDYVMVS